jgi:hypothetical protein
MTLLDDNKFVHVTINIDVLKCGDCGGSLKPIAALTDSGAIKRYLTHIGLGYLAAS